MSIQIIKFFYQILLRSIYITIYTILYYIIGYSNGG